MPTGKDGFGPKKIDYFHPSRTQPFIITFFQAVIAFKRVCRIMKKRLFRNKHSCVNRRISNLQLQLRRSRDSVSLAAKGCQVILPDLQHEDVFAKKEKRASHPHVRPEHINRNLTNHHVLVQEQPQYKRNERLIIAVGRQLEDYYTTIRQGKSNIVVERLQKNLIGSIEIEENKKKRNIHTRRVATPHIIQANDIGNVLQKNDYFQSITAAALNAEEIQNDEMSLASNQEMDYLPGTSIYFGAAVAIQAKHGGYLSYSSSILKASAHKIMTNTRFVVKNSEDLTDIGLMKYGDALWLQAGHNEVLGAQYGSLVDQKRTIQPGLISCKRQNMFKAQQYGRWIVLNRDDPMGTMGKPVLHQDKILLEQEWSFLASYSPSESNMYKWPLVTDDIYEQCAADQLRSAGQQQHFHPKKPVNLFEPADECTWKIHLVALPSEDKEEERQRTLLLQNAMDQIEHSANNRYAKSQVLLSSLASTLRKDLTDEGVMMQQLAHKRNLLSNQENLYQLYKRLESNGFESVKDPAKFLGRIYGADSQIVKYKQETIKVKEVDYNFVHHVEAKHEVKVSKLEKAEENYWKIAQKVLMNTKGWEELSSAMKFYYNRDVIKKINAVLVIQRCVRKFLFKIFNFERAMKRVDDEARQRIVEKQIAKRKLQYEQTLLLNDSKENNGAITANEIFLTSNIIKTQRVLSAQSQNLRSRKSVISMASDNVFITAGAATDNLPVRPTSAQVAIIEQIQNEHIEIATAAHAAATQLASQSYVTQVQEIKAQEAKEELTKRRMTLVTSFSEANLMPFFNRTNTSLLSTMSEESTSPGKLSRGASVAQLLKSIPHSTVKSTVKRDNEKLYNRLRKSKDNQFGLPNDVFEDPHFDVGLKTGLKFLKAMSSNPSMYDDVKVVKKARPKTASTTRQNSSVRLKY